MKKLRLLLTMIIVLAAVSVQAQNTGKEPYVGSSHTYTIIRGIAGSNLNWTVLDKDGNTLVTPTDHFTMGTNGTESVSITWLKASLPAENYIVQVAETRVFTGVETAAGAPGSGCPTLREIIVTVKDNAFDVYAELNSAEDECAMVSSPVVDFLGDGSNGNDVFGTTTRAYTITAEGNSGNWNYTYKLTSSQAVGNLKVNGDDYANDTYATGVTVSGIAVATQTITVTYQTNMSQQDLDLDLVLTIVSASDALNTPDGDSTLKPNAVTYNVWAVPATTGIQTDN